MGDALFYHLTRSPLEVTLPMLLSRSLQNGWRVVVRGQDAARLDWLDQQLWRGADESFLPHGTAGGPHDALQPILLTTGGDRPNGAQCLIVVDGADVEPGEAADLSRVCVIFDGNDDAARDKARGQWRSLTAAGIAAQYWSEDSGRWQKKAESGTRMD
ncbi:DNA polymerase III subunit chi [Defluviimonas sp. WL0002]|uniref:DNA polymerase III subunit chi n=1 Tax=Albidovulum marisflavi TaxID=2984159 RepID=A0ABT2ZH95_9RHOB|nr:DNA polymerase III subunit chi [Defluviimonas sp. WL0002]MCV2870512.1 DNA polymerase III subunit chi [Defluviimonas sp. WL0002]